MHATLGELRRQQVEHAQVVLRFARALIARVLVEQQVGVFAVGPGGAVDREVERLGREVGIRVVVDNAVNRHAAIGDQRTALTS